MAVKYSSEQYRFRMENVSMPTPHASIPLRTYITSPYMYICTLCMYFVYKLSIIKELMQDWENLYVELMLIMQYSII